MFSYHVSNLYPGKTESVNNSFVVWVSTYVWNWVYSSVPGLKGGTHHIHKILLFQHKDIQQQGRDKRKSHFHGLCRCHYFYMAYLHMGLKFNFVNTILKIWHVRTWVCSTEIIYINSIHLTKLKLEYIFTFTFEDVLLSVTKRSNTTGDCKWSFIEQNKSASKLHPKMSTK